MDTGAPADYTPYKQAALRLRRAARRRALRRFWAAIRIGFRAVSAAGRRYTPGS